MGTRNTQLVQKALNNVMDIAQTEVIVASYKSSLSLHRILRAVHLIIMPLKLSYGNFT